jgi:hypothetical protein
MSNKVRNFEEAGLGQGGVTSCQSLVTVTEGLTVCSNNLSRKIRCMTHQCIARILSVCSMAAALLAPAKAQAQGPPFGWELLITQPGSQFSLDQGSTWIPCVGIPYYTFDFGGEILTTNVGLADTIVAVYDDPATNYFVGAEIVGLQLRSQGLVTNAAYPNGEYIYITLDTDEESMGSLTNMSFEPFGSTNSGYLASSFTLYYEVRAGSLSGSTIGSGSPLSLIGMNMPWTNDFPANSAVPRIEGVNHHKPQKGKPNSNMHPNPANELKDVAVHIASLLPPLRLLPVLNPPVNQGGGVWAFPCSCAFPCTQVVGQFCTNLASPDWESFCTNLDFTNATWDPPSVYSTNLYFTINTSTNLSPLFFRVVANLSVTPPATNGVSNMIVSPFRAR